MLSKDLDEETVLINGSKPITEKSSQESSKKTYNSNINSKVINGGFKEQVFENKDSVLAKLYEIKIKKCDNDMQVKVEIKNNLKDKTEISYKLLEEDVIENEDSTSIFKVILNMPIPSQWQDVAIYESEMIGEDSEEEVSENRDSTLIPANLNQEVRNPKNHVDNDMQVKIKNVPNESEAILNILEKEAIGEEDLTSEFKVIPKRRELRCSNKMDEKKAYQSNSIQKLVNKTDISDNSLNKKSSDEKSTDTIEHNTANRHSPLKNSHPEHISETISQRTTKLEEDQKLKLLKTCLSSKVDSEESDYFSCPPKTVDDENCDGNVKVFNDMHTNDTAMDSWETLSYRSAFQKMAPPNIEVIPEHNSVHKKNDSDAAMKTNKESKCNIFTENMQLAKIRRLAEFHRYFFLGFISLLLYDRLDGESSDSLPVLTLN